MHDLGFFRANLEQVGERLSTRGPITGLDQFRGLDQRRRGAITEAEELKARRNTESAEIQKLKKAGRDTTEKQQQVREIGSRITALDDQIKVLDEQFRELLAGIPNLPHESVPVGRSADDNVEVRRCGEPRQFDFAPKAHWELGPELGILDLERAAKITGARFAVYWGIGARSRARPHQLHAGRPHARARLHRSSPAFPGELRQLVRYGPATQVRRRPVQV